MERYHQLEISLEITVQVHLLRIFDVIKCRNHFSFKTMEIFENRSTDWKQLFFSEVKDEFLANLRNKCIYHHQVISLESFVFI